MVYNMGYSREKHGISLAKTMGYKGKNYGIYYGIYLTKNEGDIFVTQWDLFRNMGYIWKEYGIC